MTYNPNTEKIYVTIMDEIGSIGIINPNDLSNDGTLTLSDGNGNVITTHGIAYDRINNRYITADAGTMGKNYSIFDSNFNYVRTVVTERTEDYTLQGIETDGKYIYRTLCDGTGHKNYIYVWSFDAELVKVIEVPDTREIETVAYDWNGNWYTNFNISGGGLLYYCNFHEKVEFGTVLQLHKILDAYI